MAIDRYANQRPHYGDLSPGVPVSEVSVSYVPSATQYEMVKQFHIAFDLPVQNVPKLPELSLVVTSLDSEHGEPYQQEVDTLIKASGLFLEMVVADLKAVQNPDQRILRMRLLLEEVHEYVQAEYTNDIVGIADGLADILYIANGTAVAYGIPLDPIFTDVHLNNMTKLGPDGKPIKKNGKVVKPDTYKPVNIDHYFEE